MLAFGRLTPGQYRCHAGVGAGEDLCPLITGLGLEPLGEDVAQFVVAGQLELTGDLGGVQAEAGHQLREELRLDGSDGHVTAVGRLVGPVIRGAAVEQERLAFVAQRAGGPHGPHHLGQHADAVDHRGVDHLALAGFLALEQCGDDADDHQHRAATEVGHEVQRGHRRTVAEADRREGTGLRQVVDVVTGGGGQRAVLAPAGDAGEDQPRIDRFALGRADTEAFTGAGPETVQQHIGFGDQVQQLARLGLDVQIDDALAAVQQVDVLGGHGQATGATHSHHVGPQVRQHHRGVWPGADAAEFDNSHSGERSGVGHARHTKGWAKTATPSVTIYWTGSPNSG